MTPCEPLLPCVALGSLHVHDELEGARAEAVDSLADVRPAVGRGVHAADLEVPVEVAGHRVPRPAVGVDSLIPLKRTMKVC